MAAQVAIVVFRNVTPVSPRNCVGERARVGERVVAEDDRADVEAVPAEPQEAGADHGERQVVRPHRLLHEADALADDQGEHQARDTGVDVDDRAAGVVLGERRVLGQICAGEPAAAPDVVGDREVATASPRAAGRRARTRT